jgi:RNA polymerase sigma factor (sigma-70 family)
MARGDFPTTAWSTISQARRGHSDASRAALAALCEAYWWPLYNYARRRGCSAGDAGDLTQGYFALLIEKDYLHQLRIREGRFRAFLLTSFRHFISKSRDRARALKRGGASRGPSLDANAADSRYALEPRDTDTPESLFERDWALTLLERALERLRQEAIDAGRELEFERLRQYLTGEEPRAPYSAVAADLRSTEAAVKMAVHRLRRRYGCLLREEISQTVAGPSDVDAELRYLLARLRPWEPSTTA